MKTAGTDLVPLLIETLARSVKLFADRPLFGTRRSGAWNWTTYGEFSLLVERMIEAADRFSPWGYELENTA